mmetsp:Transcript_65937/g.129985  ORF Transcript_65937/g.129985 Transcript_65937/m.129985 type:complete len:117 (+) Transcript_65937:75-425(+)
MKLTAKATATKVTEEPSCRKPTGEPSGRKCIGNTIQLRTPACRWQPSFWAKSALCLLLRSSNRRTPCLALGMQSLHALVRALQSLPLLAELHESLLLQPPPPTLFPLSPVFASQLL